MIRKNLSYDTKSQYHIDIQMRQTFGDWLKETREVKEISQTTLAKRSGVTKGYISNLERNIRQSVSNELVKPSVEAVDKIAKGLGVSIDEARLKAGYAPENIQPYPKELVMDYDGFDDDDLKEIAAFIQFRKQRKEAGKQK